MTSNIFALAGKRVWVAGARGMVGAALVRRLASEQCEIIEADRDFLDLRDQHATRAWATSQKPDAVFLAAARVGGIHANDTYPADFLYDNLMIEANIIEASLRAGVSKLLFLGSSCIYPKFAKQPIFEEELLTGPLEPTNEWYAVAKIAGIKLCQAFRKQHGADFISAMPANLYGPNDNFDFETSHVIAALMRKAHEAKRSGAEGFVIWGTGSPRREFLHVDDCADACVHLMKSYSDSGHVNVGAGTDVPILELAHLIARVVGFEGKVTPDLTKPDGTPRKLLDVSKLSKLGWNASISLPDGLASTYEWFVENVKS